MRMLGILVIRRWIASALKAWLLCALVFANVLPAQASAAVQEPGAVLFEQHCVGCHVNGGNVIRRGKTLKLEALTRQGLASPEAIAQIAASGIGQMSGYSEVLGTDGAETVGHWVWQQAQLGWR